MAPTFENTIYPDFMFSMQQCDCPDPEPQPEPKPEPPASPPIIILGRGIQSHSGPYRQYSDGDPEPPQSPPVIIIRDNCQWEDLLVARDGDGDPEPPASPPVVILGKRIRPRSHSISSIFVRQSYDQISNLDPNPASELELEPPISPPYVSPVFDTCH